MCSHMPSHSLPVSSLPLSRDLSHLLSLSLSLLLSPSFSLSLSLSLTRPFSLSRVHARAHSFSLSHIKESQHTYAGTSRTLLFCKGINKKHIYILTHTRRHVNITNSEYVSRVHARAHSFSLSLSRYLPNLLGLSLFLTHFL